jgi:hypothetical protein
MVSRFQSHLQALNMSNYAPHNNSFNPARHRQVFYQSCIGRGSGVRLLSLRDDVKFKESWRCEK